MKRICLTYLFIAAVNAGLFSQISLTGGAVTENFNSLVNTGTSTVVPAGWAFNETGTNANTTYTAGTGSGTGGDTYSFGSTSATDRSFGGLRSGSLNPTIGASFTNNTGATILSLNISYTGEQWRLGATGRVDRMDFQYSLNATSLVTGTWTDVNSLDFTSPVTAGAVGALDGNAAANRTTISFTITGLSIANGATFWIRWNDFDGTGSDDGQGVDDFSLIPTTSTNTLTTGAVSTSPFSVGCATTASGTVAFTSTGTFNAGNIYTAQLSDASGNFAAPLTVGTLSSTANSGTINITIPANTPTGSGYLIRVISSNPALAGTNSSPITINSTCVGTDLEPGDLVFVGFDTYVNAGTDKLVITNLVPLNPNTQFTLANSVYEYNAAANVSSDRWYDGNGNLSVALGHTTVTYNGASILPPGSIICIYLNGGGGGASIIDIDLNGANTTDFSHDGGPWVQFSSSSPDAIWLLQGTFSADLPEGANTYKTFNGDVLGGIQSRGVFQPFTVAGNNGGSRVSRIHPQIQCLGISTGGISDAYYGYYNIAALHIGSQRDLLANIVDFSANWTIGTTGLVNGDDVPTCNTPFTVTSYSVPGKWTGASDQNWFYCGNWENFTVPDDSTDVIIPTSASNHCFIDYTAAYSDFYADTARCKNINIQGRELNLEGALQNILVVNKNLTIESTVNSRLDMNFGGPITDGQIRLYGNWTNNKGTNEFMEGKGTLHLLGSTNQYISTIDPIESYFNLIVNKPGGSVILNNSVEVGAASSEPIADRLGLLTLTMGHVVTGTNYLYVTNPALAAINGGSATSFVDGNLRRHTNSINLYNFPTGEGNYYMRSGVRTNDALENIVEIDAQNSGYGIYAPLEITLNNVSTMRWWDVSKISGTTPVNVRLYWNTLAGDGIVNATDLVVAHWSIYDHTASPSTLQWWNRGRSAAFSSGSIANGWVEASEAVITYSPFTFGSITPINPLPVELLSLHAKCDDGIVKINWSTASETNNSHFEIYGSMNASNYQLLSTITGAGNSNVQQNYQVEINNTERFNYFQLSQVDLNGASTVYDPLYLSCNPSESEFKAIIVGDELQLILPTSVSENLQVFITDMGGKTLLTNSIKTQVNNDSYTLAIPTIWANGIYIISVLDEADGNLYHTKIFKQ